MSVFLLIFSVENMYSQADTLNCADFPCSNEWSEYKTVAGNMGSGITDMYLIEREIATVLK